MPRNSSGVYALPPSNPVTPYTVVSTSWANPTMSDLAQGITDSLDRTGRGGMLSAFKIADGGINAPGLGFTNEPTLGMWRSGLGQMQLVNTGVNILTVLNDRVQSNLRTDILGIESYNSSGQKRIRIRNATGGLEFTPSTTADTDDWDDTKTARFGSDGSFTVKGALAATTAVVLNTLNAGTLNVTNNITGTNVTATGQLGGATLNVTGLSTLANVSANAVNTATMNVSGSTTLTGVLNANGSGTISPTLRINPGSIADTGHPLQVCGTGRIALLTTSGDTYLYAGQDSFAGGKAYAYIGWDRTNGLGLIGADGASPGPPLVIRMNSVECMRFTYNNPSGTGPRFIADFGNTSTPYNVRPAFQASSGNAYFNVIPGSGGTNAAFQAWSDPTMANSTLITMGANGYIVTDKTGSGTAPIIGFAPSNTVSMLLLTTLQGSRILMGQNYATDVGYSTLTIGKSGPNSQITLGDTAAGGSAPYKHIRVNSGGYGLFEVINSAFSTYCLTLSDVGVLNLPGSGAYQYAGVTVVSSRKTGWAAWSGTATRSSVATGTATAAQCAQAIKALIDDLMAHGLIGA